jgi:hypothetical protein
MKIHPFAIIFGIVTDIGLSMISSLGLPIFGVSTNNPYLYHWSLILGLVAIAAGGHVTSISSSSSKEFNVVVFGVVEILIGLLISVFVTVPLWFNAASSVLIVPPCHRSNRKDAYVPARGSTELCAMQLPLGLEASRNLFTD